MTNQHLCSTSLIPCRKHWELEIHNKWLLVKCMFFLCIFICCFLGSFHSSAPSSSASPHTPSSPPPPPSYFSSSSSSSSPSVSVIFFFSTFCLSHMWSKCLILFLSTENWGSGSAAVWDDERHQGTLPHHQWTGTMNCTFYPCHGPFLMS